jgi:hypothetical protein
MITSAELTIVIEIHSSDTGNSHIREKITIDTAGDAK